MRTETLPLDRHIVRTLSGVSTATLTTVLLKKGLRKVWLKGTIPIKRDQPRRVGRAFTLRFVPAREDLATPASWGARIPRGPERGHGRRPHCRGRCHGCRRRRYFWRHPVCPHEETRRGRTGHRRRYP